MFISIGTNILCKFLRYKNMEYVRISQPMTLTRMLRKLAQGGMPLIFFCNSLPLQFGEDAKDIHHQSQPLIILKRTFSQKSLVSFRLMFEVIHKLFTSHSLKG